MYGAYHALETLSQMMQYDFDTQSYFIIGCPWTIVDYPRFPHRGLLVDSSRHFEPVQTLKNVIDSVTYAKLNVIHWHIVDEQVCCCGVLDRRMSSGVIRVCWCLQAFPFDSPSFPLLSKMGAYSNYERFTVDDVAEVVEYARQRGVRVMVEIGKQ